MTRKLRTMACAGLLLATDTAWAVTLHCQGRFLDGTKGGMYVEWDGNLNAYIGGRRYDVVARSNVLDLYLNPDRTHEGLLLDKSEERVSIDRMNGSFFVARPANAERVWLLSQAEDPGCTLVQRRF